MKSDSDIFNEENASSKSNSDAEESEHESNFDKDSNISDKQLFSAFKKTQKIEYVDQKDTIDNEDYIEVDGEKIEPFSLQKELNEGKFDKNGNFVPDAIKEDNESDHTYSDETSENEEDNTEYLIKNLKKLIPLIWPKDNAQDALMQCGKSDTDKVIQITEACTELLDLGFINIYTESVDSLQKQLNDALKFSKQKKAESKKEEETKKPEDNEKTKKEGEETKKS